MNATLPTYKNAKGNIYACGQAEEAGKSRAYQIKDGKHSGPVRVLDFSEMDLVGTVTLKNWKVVAETTF
jgi:hypothetical protein